MNDIMPMDRNTDLKEAKMHMLDACDMFGQLHKAITATRNALDFLGDEKDKKIINDLEELLHRFEYHKGDAASWKLARIQLHIKDRLKQETRND